MALSQEKIDLIVALVKKGGMSNRAIALEVGCGNKVVGQIIKKFDVEKDTIATLAKAEIENIIIANGIKATKATMNDTERHTYDEVFLAEYNKAQAQDEYHLLNMEILQASRAMLKGGTKDVKVNAGDGLQRVEPVKLDPNDMATLAKAGQIASDSLGFTQRHSAQPSLAVQVNSAGQAGADVIDVGLSDVMAEKPENSEQAQIRYDNAMKKRKGELK